MYKVAIKKNETGEVRVSQQEYEWDESQESWWLEGNMGCDCNRALEFARAGGEPEPNKIYCGDNRYSIVYFELPDGTRIEEGEEISG